MRFSALCIPDLIDHTVNYFQITHLMKKILLFSIILCLAGSLAASAQQLAPKFKTTQEKEQWFKAQDSLRYAKKVADAKKNSDPGTTTITPTSTQLVDEPGFPVYVNTGNKEQDDANYKAAKDKWIQEHPERYKQMTGQPK
jgi:hypothetical protein